MIDEEQYQHVLANGSLPGGSVITNSPVPVAEQAGWNRLTEHNVITAEELAGVLFNGKVPDMTPEESQAFADVAPIYQPNRAKRLTYDLRHKHARVELIRLAHRLREEYEARTDGLEERAKALDIPMERGDAVLTYIDEHDHPHYMAPLGMDACDTISTDEVWTTNAVGQVNTNFNLTGASITLAMWDVYRAITGHAEFDGRISYPSGSTMNFHSHPTAVAGIMIATGVNTNARGMAYEATLHAYDIYKQGHRALLADVAGGDLIRFSNHSYSDEICGWKEGTWYGDSSVSDKEDYKFGWYSSDVSTRDNIIYTSHYHLPVMAAGNDRYIGDTGYGYPPDYSPYYWPDNLYPGFDTLSAGIAKNVLCVGGVHNISGGYTNSVVMAPFSSFGPIDDGRIKPDLVASGYNYDGGWGTSFAAPAVTGSLGLLQELHERLSGTNGIPLLASTYKGLVIHTADEAGDTPGPDYRFGWGLMNTLSAVQLMIENAQWNSNPFIKEVMLPDGKCITFSVEKIANEPLRITICWSDPPGLAQGYGALDQTTPRLINDLDLFIIDPTGQTNFSWVLNPTVPTDAATRGTNVFDNVEQVVITNTVAGTYTVVISHKGTLLNDGQQVSVILSGNIPENIDPNIDFSITTNGLPRLEFTSALGAVYEILGATDLRFPWSAVPDSPISTIHTPTEWIDPAGSTNDVRFYKVQQIK